MKTKKHTLVLLCGVAGLNVAFAGVSADSRISQQTIGDSFVTTLLKEFYQPGADLKSGKETATPFGNYSMLVEEAVQEKPMLSSMIVESTDNFSVGANFAERSLKERIQSGEIHISSMNKLLEKTQELSTFGVREALKTAMLKGLQEKKNRLDIALGNAQKFIINGAKGQIDFLKEEFRAVAGASFGSEKILQDINNIKSLGDASTVGASIYVLIKQKRRALETGQYDPEFRRKFYVDKAQRVFEKEGIGYTVENALFSNGAFAGLVLFKATTKESLVVFADGEQSVSQKRAFGDMGNANDGLEGNAAFFKAFSDLYVDLQETLGNITDRTSATLTPFCLGGKGTGAALALQAAQNIGEGCAVKVTEMPEVYTEASAKEVRRSLGSGNVIASSNKNTTLGWALGLTVVADQVDTPQPKAAESVQQATKPEEKQAAESKPSFFGKVARALNPRNWW